MWDSPVQYLGTSGWGMINFEHSFWSAQACDAPDTHTHTGAHKSRGRLFLLARGFLLAGLSTSCRSAHVSQLDVANY